ncbi:unnamed protein product [Ectocarpus fasciculatus]
MLYRVLGLLTWQSLTSCSAFHVRLPSSRGALFSNATPKQLTMSTVTPSGPSTAALPVFTARTGEVFNWNKQWYPVLAADHVDPGRAHAVQLLGKNLVVWRNKEGRWSGFDDRCPHRAAPLTEGRIEDDGSLLCAYHAWRFDADGKCLNIPQSDRGGKDEARPKACAKVYPTQVAQDMIWVWAENGPDAGLESALTPPHLIPELDDEQGLASGRVFRQGVQHTDLAYGWDIMIENFVDPAHVPCAHHGIAGDRYKDARPINVEPDEEWPVTATSGFRFKFDDELTSTQNQLTFVPPCLVLVENSDYAGTLKMTLYGIPTKPGWSRLVGRQAYVHKYAPKSKEAKALHKENKRLGNKPSELLKTARITSKFPQWLMHASSGLFLYQDMAFLHHQEKTLASVGYDGTSASSYANAVYTPAPADRAVMAVRKWIAKHGSGGPAWDKDCDTTLPEREHNREALFDFYEGHTKTCSTCMRALKNVNRLLAASKTATVASFTWALLRGARAVSTPAAVGSRSAGVINAVTARAMLPAVALTLASMGAVKVLEKLRGLYHTYSFHQQDNP